MVIHSLFPPPIDSSMLGFPAASRESDTVEASVERIWAEKGPHAADVARFFRRVIDELPRGEWSDGATRLFLQLMAPRHVDVEGLPMRNLLAHVSNERRAWAQVKTGLSHALTEVNPAATQERSDVVQQYLQYVRGSMATELPQSAEIVSHINAFLSHSERSLFGKLNRATAEAWKGEEADHKELRALIQAAPRGICSVKAEECFQKLHNFKGPIDCWRSCMESFLRRIENRMVNAVDHGLNIHGKFANALCKSRPLVAPDPAFEMSLGRFLTYLMQKAVDNRVPPGIFLRIMQCYLERGLDSSGLVTAAIRAYLSEATRKIGWKDEIISLASGAKFRFTQARVAPYWFAHPGERYSYWPPVSTAEGEPGVISCRLLSEALWTMLEAKLTQQKNGRYFVLVQVPAEFPMPSDFLLPLAQKVTDAGMYWWSTPTISPTNVNRPHFVRNLYDPEQIFRDSL